MTKSHKPFYWTFEKCFQISQQYESRIDLFNCNNKAYNAARRHGWLDACCKHMKHSRLIYAFEFDDNSVYIGLTYNPKKRKQSHFNDKSSTVYKHIKKTNLIPTFIVLSNYVNIDAAPQLEIDTINKYQSNGWTILNKIHAGGLGGNQLIWSKENCFLDSKKYTTKKEWRENSQSAYNASLRNKWFDECVAHMKQLRNKKGYWSLIKCIEQAKKFNSKVEWMKNHNYSYSIAIKNDWINDCSKHMTDPRKKWTYDTCAYEASKFETKNIWRTTSPTSYSIACKNKWTNLIWQSKHQHQHQD